MGATSAAAGDPGAASAVPEFTLAPDRGLVGSFAGYGGQLNQHVYAKISGPPPPLAALEDEGASRSEPQLVRIFFNTDASGRSRTAWTSFVRTVALAHRANAEINITWQGSTFDFAMRNMDRFADVLAGPRARTGSPTASG